MKRKTMLRLGLVTVIVGCWSAPAQSQDLVLRASVFGMGGMSTGGDTRLIGTLGEFAPGRSAGAGGILDAGFVPTLVNTAGPLAIPVAVDDAATTDEDTPVEIAVLDNDIDPAEGQLTMLSATAPAHGEVRFSETFSVIYTPDLDFFGQDSLTYRIRNDVGGIADAVIRITVNPVNDAPRFTNSAEVAAVVGQVYRTTLVAVDVEGDPIELGTTDLPDWLAEVGATDSSITVAGTPSITDVGEYTLTFTASDGIASVGRQFVVSVVSTAPGVAQPLLPEDGGTVAPGAVQFVWRVAESAMSYAVEVSETDDFAASRRYTVTADTTLTVEDVPADIVRYWRVRATNAIGDGDYSEVFSFATATNVANETVDELPRAFELYQNYPNPFNPSTTITFDLAESTEVKLTVYDTYGRVIEALVSERRAAGTYSVSFDAGDLATGSYFYRIRAGSWSKTRQFVLLR